MITHSSPARRGDLETTRGLTSREAQRRLASFGPNRIVPEERRHGRLHRFLRPLSDPMVLLLIVAGATYLGLRDYTDAIVVFVALVPIMLVTLVLETRSERALKQLRILAAPTAVVIRDGVRRNIRAQDLVPGDIWLLEEGDVIPADGRLVQGTNVMVDESALSGESQPLAKHEDAPGEDALFAGTTVLSGRGMAKVQVTGERTRYGQIGVLLAGIHTSLTPLQRLIRRLIQRLALVAAFFCLAVVVLELVGGHGWSAAIIAGVSLAMAAVPEEFPMVYTLYLSLGAWRLARGHALVRHLAAVETLGSATVICTDKTGTLTMGTLAIGALAPIDEASVDTGQPLTPSAVQLIEAAVLACEPNPFDPLEQAILRFAETQGVDIQALHHGTLVYDYPFDPTQKYVTHVWRRADRHRIAAKGAIEGLVARVGLAGQQRDALLEANRMLASRGMRVIAVAAGALSSTSGDRLTDERQLRLLGLLAFTDPLRPGVREALRSCRRAGIRVILITGDHPVTAHAVAEDLSLAHDDARIATGEEIDRADDGQLTRLVREVNIFARTHPEQKYRLVTALRADGETVAMTGDGTNDAPALREADIGVAMGQRGTEVARAAAELILLDHNFATIVTAVRGGRRIFDNLRRAFTYLIAFHIPIVLPTLIAPLAGLPLLLLPVHLIWLELIVHPTASLVFQAEEGSADLMRQPPRRRQDLVTRADVLRATTAGLVLASDVLGLFVVQLRDGIDSAGARTAALAALIIGQLAFILVEHAHPRPINRTVFHNKTLIAVATAVLLTLLLGIYVPVLAGVLRLTPLSPSRLGVAAAVGLAATLWQVLVPVRRRRHQATREHVGS